MKQLLLVGFSFLFLLIVTDAAVDPKRNIGDFLAYVESEMPTWQLAHWIPSATVGLVHDGNVVAVQSFGEALPNSIFQIGSISKTVTAWAIMHLAEKGIIDLDAPIEQYINWTIPIRNPDVPNADGVTARRVLSHTAGLSVSGYYGFPFGSTLPTTLEVLEGDNNCAGNVYVQYVPGTIFSYSGGGYVVLQRLIEVQTGQPFEDALESLVLSPLLMSTSSFVWNPTLQPNTVSGYNTLRFATPRAVFAAKAPAGLFSTASDLARFAAAVVRSPMEEPPGRGVISSHSLQAMWTPTEQNTQYGLGYEVWNVSGVGRVVGHKGAIPGFRSVFRMSPSARDGYVLLLNSENGDAVLHLMDCVWLNWLQGQPMSNCPLYMPRQEYVLIAAGVLGFFGLAYLSAVIFCLATGKRECGSAIRGNTMATRVLRYTRLLVPWLLLFGVWLFVYVPMAKCGHFYLAMLVGSSMFWLMLVLSALVMIFSVHGCIRKHVDYLLLTEHTPSITDTTTVVADDMDYA